MAGSKKYFVYTTNNGDDFALLADESNTEALNGGTQDYVNGLEIQYTIPGNLRPRAVVYGNAANTRNIRCYALTASIYNNALGGVTQIDDPLGGNAPLTLKRLEPERITILPIAADTGLNDGDDT